MNNLETILKNMTSMFTLLNTVGNIQKTLMKNQYQ